jgi:hypothetical protein
VVGEVLAERVEKGAVVAVDGADPAEEEVVLPHLLQALLGDTPASRHVLQERDHVVRALRASEGEEQQGVVRSGV